MTHIKALQAGHSNQGTSEPITPVQGLLLHARFSLECRDSGLSILWLTEHVEIEYRTKLWSWCTLNAVVVTQLSMYLCADDDNDGTLLEAKVPSGTFFYGSLGCPLLVLLKEPF